MGRHGASAELLLRYRSHRVLPGAPAPKALSDTIHGPRHPRYCVRLIEERGHGNGLQHRPAPAPGRRARRRSRLRHSSIQLLRGRPPELGARHPPSRPEGALATSEAGERLMAEPSPFIISTSCSRLRHHIMKTAKSNPTPIAALGGMRGRHPVHNVKFGRGGIREIKICFSPRRDGIHHQQPLGTCACHSNSRSLAPAPSRKKHK